MRASTENLISIVGMATATASHTSSRRKFPASSKLGQELVNGLADYDFYVNGSDDHLPFVLEYWLPRRPK